MKRISSTRNTVSDVTIVRLNVSLIARVDDRFLISATQVTHIHDPVEHDHRIIYRETDHGKERQRWSAGGRSKRERKRYLSGNENTASVTSTSCNKVRIVPAEYLQSRETYKYVYEDDQDGEDGSFYSASFRSSEMVGWTVMKPLIFFFNEIPK